MLERPPPTGHSAARRALLERGIKVTVNSDDPAYFGGYVDDNLDALTEAGHLTREDLVTLARNSIEASFAAPGRKQQLLKELGVALGEPDGKHRGTPGRPM